MLSSKEIWMTESERIERRKVARKINEELKLILRELKMQPCNRIYVNLHFNNIIKMIKEKIL